MWEALEHSSFVELIGTTGWLYATVSVSHYVTMFWFIGSIAVVDLRIIGLTARDRSVGELSRELFPWVWTGCVLAIISGFLLFATAAADWAPSPQFHVKLTFMGLAIVFAAIVQSSAGKWSRTPDPPTVAKLIALISLGLWIATIVSGSEIPALEGLG